MSYITNTDIEERLGTVAYIQLTDDAGTGAADLDKVEAARQGAMGEVDSYLATRYSVPIDLVAHPELAGILKSVSLDLVEYRLHARRPPVHDDVARKREEAVAWLQAVARGEAVLPAASAPASTTAIGLVGETIGPERQFSRESLESA